jgi:hypothetical protein
MSNSWRTGLVLALTALVGGTASKAQQVGVASSGRGGGNGNGVSSTTVQDDATKNAGSARTLDRAQQRIWSRFNRVTSVRQEAVRPSSPATQTARSRTPADGSRVPSGSGWERLPQQPASPPQITTRSKARTYFPGMRPTQQLNLNTAQVARAGQGRSRASAGLLPMFGAQRARTAKGGQLASPTPGRSLTLPAGRR